MGLENEKHAQKDFERHKHKTSQLKYMILIIINIHTKFNIYSDFM